MATQPLVTLPMPVPRNGPVELAPPPPGRLVASQKRLIMIEQERAVVTMKKDGWSNEAIAKKLKITINRVNLLVDSALTRSAKEYSGDIEQMRTLELQRLDDLHLRMMRQVKSKDIPAEIAQGAVDRILKIHDRRVRLTAMDREPEPDNARHNQLKAEAIMAPLLRGATDDELIRLREIARGVKERGTTDGRTEAGGRAGDTPGHRDEAGAEAQG